MLKSVLVPAALAILLHDKEVWKELKEQHGLTYIEFDMDPTAFLLLFCDCIQEWGRPREADSDAEEKQRFLLDQFEKSDEKYSLTIRTPSLKSTEPMFRKKETEGKDLEDILLGPQGVKFEVKLADSSKEVKKRVPFNRNWGHRRDPIFLLSRTK